MIFLGDLACPPERITAFSNAVEKLDVLCGQVVVVNLEAVILDGKSIKHGTLYSHESVLDGIQKKARKVIVSLANNHMYDYPEAILPTKEFLEKKGAGVFGLLDSDKGIVPYEFDDEDGSYAFFGHCWNLYSATNPNLVNDVRIVDCAYDKFFEQVKSYIGRNGNRKVYCFMHWNYDMEQMPFPMHVKLSHDLIDAGVEGVIGSHSHVTQCVEIYKNRPVAYCLGNFYLPSGIYFGGKLVYPDSSKHSIGLRIDSGRTDVLRFETDMEEPLRLIGTEALRSASPLPTSDIGSYTRLFRKHRTKRFLVPVFKSYSGPGYEFRNRWAIYRIKLIKRISKIIDKLR